MRTRHEIQAALKAKRDEAAFLWNDFDAARKKAIEQGIDVVSNPRSTGFKALDQAYAAYEPVAEECKRLEAELLAAVDREGLGGGGSKHASGAEFARLDGIAAKFFETLGHGAELKALVSGASPVPPFFDERIRVMPARTLFVRSLIPVVPAEGDLVQYTRQIGGLPGSAAPVGAGALKPMTAITIERVQTNVRTIAHISEAIDRAIIDDLAGLTDLLDSTLRLGVLLAEETQLLNGDGTGVNLTGIFNTAGIGSVARTTESRTEMLMKGLTNVRLAFFEPDAIVLHPTDWQSVRLEKTADGDYLAGPVVDEDPPTLWGKAVVTSPVMTLGKALVGAFGVGARIWDREQARVDFAETGLGDAAGQELFSRNMVRFRAEERIAFGVERPAAFCEVTNLT